ncbi:PP2C-like protein [Echria macrotheca]|uniref:PP2C-like protein n=1 Tax=Echria macrotheca TaxID=438768 RepID=A0AAJ0F069_9PEZI|nr:PP2C-like protein [Echria macrotheca]
MFTFRGIHRQRLHKPFVRFQSTASPPRPARLPLVIATGAASFALGWYTPQMFTSNSKTSTPAPPNPASTGPPTLDTKAGYPFSFSEPPTEAEVTEILNSHAWSVTLPPHDTSDITRYDGCQLASNSECEDRYIHGRFPSPLPGTNQQDWLAFGVFDGHLGAQTAALLTKHLIPYVHQALAQSSPQDIHAAISSAFTSLDDAFVLHAKETLADPSLSWSQKLVRLVPGSNGSCALLALYDPSSGNLHVACTGDSRAVMCRLEDPSTKEWKLEPLSIDQGGGSATEKARVAAEHPGEDVDRLVKNGRVLGLATARAFGDGHWKWDLETLQKGKEGYFADTLRAHDGEVYQTPPYVTARPEVTTTEIKKGGKAVMIMASDGFWDAVTSQQAVELVARWVEWRGRGCPPEQEGNDEKFGGNGFDWTVRRKDWWGKVNEEKWTVRDGNAAVHLTRNALGGKHHDLVSGLLALRPPFSRWARDDITVQVVFFNC